MKKPSLHDLLRQQFPNADFSENTPDLMVGSFPEWDSLANFNFLMRVEVAYATRFNVKEMSELESLEDIARSLADKNITL